MDNEVLKQLEQMNKHIVDLKLENYRKDRMDYITPEIVELTKSWLGSDGVGFFRETFLEHGEISPVIKKEGLASMPHSVHLNEGMQVRNMLRNSGLCLDWNSHDFDNLWEIVVERAISPLPKPTDFLAELTKMSQEMGGYETDVQFSNLNDGYEITTEESKMLLQKNNITPQEEDLRYFYAKLGKMAESSDRARLKVVKQIRMLEEIMGMEKPKTLQILVKK